MKCGVEKAISHMKKYRSVEAMDIPLSCIISARYTQRTGPVDISKAVMKRRMRTIMPEFHYFKLEIPDKINKRAMMA